MDVGPKAPTPQSIGGERILFPRDGSWTYTTQYGLYQAANPLAEAIKGSLDWTKPNFDDSNWQTDKAPFGFGPQTGGLQIGTDIAPGAGNVYFRTKLTLSNEDFVLVQEGGKGALGLRVAADNNATVWFDGVQVAVDLSPSNAREWNINQGAIRLPKKTVSGDVEVLVAVQVDNGILSPDFFFSIDVDSTIS